MIGAWPADAREAFLARLGAPTTPHHRRLARGFDRWLTDCAREGSAPSDISAAVWDRRSRGLGTADRNAMRAVLCEIYGAHEELYPRDAPSPERNPRDALARSVGAALARWPKAWRDRAAPLLHVDEDPLFDGRLVMAWASTTAINVTRALARLFDEARRHGETPDGEAPDLTPSVVRAYLARAQARAAAQEIRIATVAATLGAAASVAPVLFPERDWIWLKRAERGIKRLAQKNISRSAARARPAPELYLAGCALFDEASRRSALAHCRRDLTKAYRLARAGLAIVLLITTPIRIDSLARLRFGKQLDRDVARFKLAADETKEGTPDERELPEAVRAMLRQFLAFRASIAARGETALFASERTGGRLTSGVLSREVVSVMRNLVGEPVNPHAFRHSAASFVVSEAPAEAALASTVLNHASPEMTRTYVARARQIVAGRALRAAAEKGAHG